MILKPLPLEPLPESSLNIEELRKYILELLSAVNGIPAYLFKDNDI